MQKLCEYIEDLLNTHNFVVIPAFGGFVAARQEACSIKGTLYPPTKQIGFNPDLTYNDGLLAQAVAQDRGVDLDQANTWVEAQVFEFIQSLHRYQRVAFGRLGHFYLQQGHMLFERAVTPLSLSSNFGLGAVYFPEVHASKQQVFTAPQEKVKQEAPKAAPIVKPLQPKMDKSARGFNYAAVAAVLAFFLLLIPMHFGQQQRGYRASFVAPPVLEEVIAEEPHDNADVTPICTPYHVVIGSFYTQVKALQFLDELPKELAQSQIVYSDHRFRIIAASYETEEEGLQGVQQIANAFPTYDDAWLLLYNP